MHRLWINGQRAEAQDLVPVEIAHRTNLLGDDENIKVRLRAYRDVGIDSLRVGLRGDNIDEMLNDLGRPLDLHPTGEAEAAG